MDSAEFRLRGKEVIDYIADYLENIRDHKVYPNVKPGYLHELLPDHAPEQGEDFQTIMKDLNNYIKPGLVHWQSPQMHAYFPALTSYPSILGDLLSSAFNNLCFTWAASPAGTELETIVMNWLGKMINLPRSFLSYEDTQGGGTIQTTASESTLVNLLAARTKILSQTMKSRPELSSTDILGNLIGYCSDQAHSSVEKAGLIAMVRMTYVVTDDQQSMRGDKLEQAILEDIEKGYIPFWVCCSLGSTGTCAFDNLREVGQIAVKYGLWLHVDAAYSGSAYVCPEFRHWIDGVELADSFAFNPSKWLLVHFDCSAMWVKDSKALHHTFNVNPIYLRHENSGKAIDYMKLAEDVENDVIPEETADGHVNGDIKGQHFNEDFVDNRFNKWNGADVETDPEKRMFRDILREIGSKHHLVQPFHWQIPLSKRFRSLKLWFVLRNYGVSGLQNHIRKSVRLAKSFEGLIKSDPRFEMPQESHLGLIVFRLRGENGLTERLLVNLNGRRNIHAVPAHFKGTYVIRFSITSPKTTLEDVQRDWNEIKTVASLLLKDVYGTEDGNIAETQPATLNKPKISLKETKKFDNFGTSLLLANSPMSPKVIDGTYAAIQDYNQVLNSCAQTFAQLKMNPQDSPEMRRRIRGIKMSGGNKFSLDSCMDMVQGIMVDQRELPDQLPKMIEADIEDSSGESNISSKSTSPATVKIMTDTIELQNCDMSKMSDNKRDMTQIDDSQVNSTSSKKTK